MNNTATAIIGNRSNYFISKVVGFERAKNFPAIHTRAIFGLYRFHPLSITRHETSSLAEIGNTSICLWKCDR